jgi:hypothetical protein
MIRQNKLQFNSSEVVFTFDLSFITLYTNSASRDDKGSCAKKISFSISESNAVSPNCNPTYKHAQ